MSASYLFSYRHKGQPYSFDVVANSEQEARDRVVAMSWAQFEGVLVCRVPDVGGGWLVGLICSVRNFFGKPSEG